MNKNKISEMPSKISRMADLFGKKFGKVSEALRVPLNQESFINKSLKTIFVLFSNRYENIMIENNSVSLNHLHPVEIDNK